MYYIYYYFDFSFLSIDGIHFQDYHKNSLTEKKTMNAPTPPHIHQQHRHFQDDLDFLSTT